MHFPLMRFCLLTLFLFVFEGFLLLLFCTMLEINLCEWQDCKFGPLNEIGERFFAAVYHSHLRYN